MSLKFNTFRANRYKRSKFVEGRYLLANEASDLELEMLDQMRRETQSQFGDVSIGDAWKVERLNATQILIKPGEAFYKGLLYSLRSGNDQLVTGDILSMGTVPTGMTRADDTTGLGKIITFAPGTPTNLYRLVITASEQIVTDIDDPFLKNANLTETTAQKIKIIYTLNVIPNTLQTESPIPYRDENSAPGGITNFPATGGIGSPNFVNQTVITPTSGNNGELLSTTVLTGSAGIDGRDIELVIVDNLAGVRVLPGNPAQFGFYSNGILIDSNGNSYHINLIGPGQDSLKTVIRIDKEPNQPNPVIVNTKPYTIIKRDVYVTDDAQNGVPQGKLHWPIATIDFNTTNGILHQSKITDLRNTIEQVLFNQKSLNKRVNVAPVNSGNISFTLATSTIVTASTTRLFNGINIADTLNATSYILKDNSCLAFDLKYDGSILNKGNLSISISSVSVLNATLAAVDLSNVKLGNLVKDSANAVFYITAIDDVNNIITLNAAPATGAATIYYDSFQEGYVKDDSHTYIFAVRNSNKVYIADLELEDGETSQIGDGVSQQLLTFIGTTGEADSSPNYSSEQFITDGDSLVTAIGKLDLAARHASAFKLIGGGTWANTAGGSVTIATNPTANSEGNTIFTGGNSPVAQTWLAGSNGNINTVRLSLKKVLNPTGTFKVSIFNAILSFGDYLPTGSAIATSTTTLDASTVSAGFTNYDFNFTGVPIISGSYYAFVIDATNVTFADASNNIRTELNSTSVVSGNSATASGTYASPGTWTGFAQDLKFDILGTSTASLSFTASAYLEMKGLAYTDNTILIAQSPIAFPNDGQVAYVVPNVSTGGPNLTVVVGALNTVPKNATILARREGADIIVGTSSDRLKSGQSTDLYAQMSNQNLSFIGASGTADNSPNYPSNVYVVDGNSLTTAIGTLDATIAADTWKPPVATFASLPVIGNINGDNRLVLDTRLIYSWNSSLSLWLPISGSGGTVKATFLDPISSVLPTGVSVTIDGVSGVNGDFVLFTNLSSNNNRVYKLGGVGVAITWAPERIFQGAFDPTDGDSVRIQKGTIFQEQLAVFDSVNFKVNDTIRMFNGVSTDYVELGSIKTVTLVDNTINGIVFSVSVGNNENWIVNYSVLRGAGLKETGQLLLTSDGTTVAVSNTNAYFGDTGVTFNADINSGNIRLLYTTTNTGVAATMKLFVARWSNSAGGPSGIPNYNTTPSSPITAAGATGDIQYKGSSGNLSGDVRFKWDDAEGSLNLNGLIYKSLQGPVTLLNNQVSPQTAFTYALSNKFAVVEYSVLRNTSTSVGRLLITTNGSSVSISDDNVSVGTPGITFSAIISGPNIVIQYVSTNVGFNADFKYTFRRWA